MDTYTKETFLEAYHELIDTAKAIGLPEEVGKMIARNLHSEKCLRRMSSYLRNARPHSIEEIADEMIAIAETQEKWRRKKQYEESNAFYNNWLNSDLRETGDE